MLMRRTALALLAGSCLAAGTARAADAPLPVVASFSILGDMVRQIGGDHVELTTLVGPDGDAHVYEPSPADVKTIAGAGLLVTNGLEFESWLPRLVEAAGFGGELVVASAGVAVRSFTEGAEEAHEHAEQAHDHEAAGHEAAGHEAAGHEHSGEEHGHHGAPDPHAWQNLGNGVIYARNIGEALAKADPANAADYRQAASAYAARLQALDADVKAKLGAIAPERRKVVTSHDAFGYFGDAYGIEFIAPVGLATDAEASATDVARIIDQIRADRITAVFVENITNTRLIDQISSETGATLGGALYSDALSGPAGPASTYEKMFDWNVAQLTKAMTGS